MSTRQEEVDASGNNDLVDRIVSLARTEHLLSGQARDANRTEVARLSKELRTQLEHGYAAIEAVKGAITDDGSPTIQSHNDHIACNSDTEYHPGPGDDSNVGW